MKVLLQRVTLASVSVAGEVVGRIGRGLVVFVGVANGDTVKDVNYLVQKIVDLRIFEDDAGKMNRSLRDIGGKILVVSQFTLYGDTRKGRRPSFVGAAAPEIAEPLFNSFADAFRDQGVGVETGRFGARMAVQLLNDGPVTLVIEVAAPSSVG